MVCLDLTSLVNGVGNVVSDKADDAKQKADAIIVSVEKRRREIREVSRNIVDKM